MSRALSSILRERSGRNVYIVGAANVGKSAFVRAALKEMSDFSSRNFDSSAASLGRYVPVESPMPGTTLGLIPLRAFDSGGVIFDSPGVHLHHRVQHLLRPDDVRSLLPPRRVRGFVAPTPAQVLSSSTSGGASGKVGTGPQVVYWWGGLARIEVSGCPSATPVFYGAPAMKVSWGEPQLVNGQVDREPPPGSFGREGVVKRGGMWLAREDTVATSGGIGPALELSVSGVPGWVSIYAPGLPGELKVTVWACRGVEVFARPPLPVPPPLS